MSGDRARSRLRRQGAIAVALTATALGLFASLATGAGPSYQGAVHAATKTVTLKGSGGVRLSTASGLLHHSNLGPGFASSEDFDSSRPGTQTVPDTGQWKVNVTGGGHDTLEVDEGEPADPVSYTSGHTFVPGGVPCMVRDPHDHHGLVEFSVHPKQETEFCYPHGIDNLIVRGGKGSIQYGILDTQPGVALHLYASTHTPSSIEEVAGVPTEVGGFHNPMSPVYFVGGRKAAGITFNDGVTKKPATYTISRTEIVKPGLPALHYSTQSAGSEIELYPQAGPSRINIKPTNGVVVQIFGNFFGQKGPDHIDASNADAPVLATGSLGNDTIWASPAGGYVQGGGGNPTIHALNDYPMFIECASSGERGTAYVTTLDTVKHCRTVHTSKPVVILKDASFSPRRVAPGARLTLRVPPYARGTLKLTFELSSCQAAGHCSYRSVGTRTERVAEGSTKLELSPRATLNGHLRPLPRGTYRVGLRLTVGGRHSKAQHASLEISTRH